MKAIARYLLLLLCLFVSCNDDDSNVNTSDSNYEADPENLDASGLPIQEFEVALPQLSNTKQYIIDTEQWAIPTDGTNPIDTTDNLQAAIDWAHAEGFGQVVLPQGHYLIGKYGNDIYQAGITIHGNTEFIFQPNAIVEMDTNDKWNYCVFSLEGDNIIIRNGQIKGDRDTHIFTPREGDGSTAHDEGHGICVWNDNHRVRIDAMNLFDLTGDGSLILDAEDVSFTNNNIYNNRRQGISIVGGKRISINNNEIHHINGTSPQFGIDIEGPGRIDEDIVIQNNQFHHNKGGDIVNATGENVYILDNIMYQGDENTYVDGPIVSWHKTHNIIARNTITMTTGSVNGRLGYIQYSSGGDKGHNRSTYVHENVCNSCGMYMYKSSDADVRRNQFLGYFMAFSEFDNAILMDNQVTYSEAHPNLRFCWSYRFNQVRGIANGNLLEGVLEEIPLSHITPYSMQCVIDGW